MNLYGPTLRAVRRIFDWRGPNPVKGDRFETPNPYRPLAFWIFVPIQH